jgi:hypothetical protein
MPEPTVLRVTGTLHQHGNRALLVLADRLEGYDTFLTGSLQLDSGLSMPVKILTLDDVTVLHPADTASLPTGPWSGRLRLGHGLRDRGFPADLTAAAAAANRALGALDDAETRYVVTFLSEAATDHIRTDRISVIVSALPALPGGSA